VLIRQAFSLICVLLAVVISFGVTTESWAQTCEPSPDQVAFFVDANFKGQCVVRGIGVYPNANSIGLPNDSISSVKVGGNAQAVLCKDNDFGGDCILP
jgi:hypothetical protein